MILFTATIARADELLVGALRDQDGAVVSGARVEGRDASGAVIAQDRTTADGTFAIAAPQRPSVLTVEAADADPLRLLVPAAGPVTGVVRRHRSADAVPSAADVAALPAGSLAEIATVTPYWIAFPGLIGNRWLDRGHGAVTVEGLPFYRRSDGADGSDLLPNHATGSVAVTDPLQAPFYGDRAGGGVIDAGLFDRWDSARATNGDASLLVGRNVQGFAATSWDADGQRRVAAARAVTTIGPVGASFVALSGDLPGQHYDGIGTTLRTAGATRDLTATFNLTRSADDALGILDAGSVAAFTFDVVGRGPDALAVRARWRDDHGALGDTSLDHHDAALVVGTTRGNPGGTQVSAAVALAYGSELLAGGTTPAGLAILPSLSVNAPLGPSWTAHAGLGDSSVGTPGVPLARASLGELGLGFHDGHRLRFDVLAYAEGDDVPQAVTRGFAASLGWEIAPRLSLRAWSLRDGDLEERSVLDYPGGPIERVANTRAFRRDLLWLTWDAPMRLDLLVRAGALEGDARIPLGKRYALTVGSARRLDTGKRQLSVGLVAH